MKMRSHGAAFEVPSEIVGCGLAFVSILVFLSGVLGVGVQQAVRFGIARGLFTHEAGMGSTPHAHALARVKNPCEQGVISKLTRKWEAEKVNHLDKN